jgi:hypothetical protein
MTELFGALFSDPKLQQASLTSWIDQQTVGGKVVLWPALRISCDRAANAQIDWGNVTPDGLRHLCSYSLSPGWVASLISCPRSPLETIGETRRAHSPRESWSG